MLGLADLLAGEAGRAFRLGGQAAPQGLRLAEVVVDLHALGDQLEAAGAVSLAVDGDQVGGAGGDGERGDAVSRMAAFPALPVVAARDRSQACEFLARARIDAKKRVEAGFEGAGLDDYRSRPRRRPGEPDRVAAGAAGVVRLAALLARQLREREAGGGQPLEQLFRVREIVVLRRAFQLKDEAPLVFLGVDRDPVGGARRGRESHLAVAAARVADFVLPDARHVVVRCGGRERAERRAAVDGKHGVDLRLATAGIDVDRTGLRRGPGEPDRVAAEDPGVVGLAALL